MKINNEETIGIDVNIDKEMGENKEIKANDDIDINLEDENIHSNMPKAEQLEIIDDSPTTTINIPPTEQTNLNINNEKHNNINNDDNISKEMEERYNRYRQHHHSHQKFSVKERLKIKIISFFYLLDNYINGTLDGFTNTFDLSVSKSEFPSFVKRILHAKQILLWVYIINTNFLLSKIEKNEYLTLILEYNLYGFIILVLLLNIHYYLNEKNIYLKEDKELEQYAVNRNSQIASNKCPICNVIICMRSMHCNFCNKCVVKFHFHSHFFNICVSASNELIYAFTLIGTLIFLYISFIISIYLITLYNNNLHGYKLPLHTWTFVSFYLIFKVTNFSYDFFKCLLSGLTFFEKDNFRLTYLKKNYKESFNPFEKSFCNIIWEIIVNCFNINIYKETELDNYVPINESSSEEILESHNMPLNFEQEIKAFKIMLKLKEPFKPFISKDNHVYKKINGNEIANWNRLRLYTVFDLTNSPFADILYLQAEKSIEQYNQMQKQMEMQNQIQNKNEI